MNEYEPMAPAEQGEIVFLQYLKHFIEAGNRFVMMGNAPLDIGEPLAGVPNEWQLCVKRRATRAEFENAVMVATGHVPPETAPFYYELEVRR